MKQFLSQFGYDCDEDPHLPPPTAPTSLYLPTCPSLYSCQPAISIKICYTSRVHLLPNIVLILSNNDQLHLHVLRITLIWMRQMRNLLSWQML